MSHRLFLLVAGLGAAAVLLLAAHAPAPPQPGSTIVWSTPAASQPAAGVGAAPIPRAAAPTASPSGGLLGGLQGSISGIFSRLNGETQQSASGQFSILQEISSTLRGWIEHLLSSVAAHH